MTVPSTVEEDAGAAGGRRLHRRPGAGDDGASRAADGPAAALLEGEPGTGKTEIAKVLAKMLPRHLVRLQCYDGLDLSAAAYEWNHARQLMAIRLAEAAGETDRDALERGIYDRRFRNPARCCRRWRASPRSC